jgi:hypothetical protein
MVDSFKSDQIRSSQIKSNQIKSNQIKSNQIKSNQIKIKSNQIIMFIFLTQTKNVLHVLNTTKNKNSSSLVLEQLEYTGWPKECGYRIGCEEGRTGIGKYTVKKASDFPVPSRDVTNFFFTVSV